MGTSDQTSRKLCELRSPYLSSAASESGWWGWRWFWRWCHHPGTVADQKRSVPHHRHHHHQDRWHWCWARKTCTGWSPAEFPGTVLVGLLHWHCARQKQKQGEVCYTDTTQDRNRHRVNLLHSHRTETDTVWSLLHWHYTGQKQTQGDVCYTHTGQKQTQCEVWYTHKGQKQTEGDVCYTHTGQKQTQCEVCYTNTTQNRNRVKSASHTTQNRNRHRVSLLFSHKTETLKQTQSEVCYIQTDTEWSLLHSHNAGQKHSNRHRVKSATLTQHRTETGKRLLHTQDRNR